MSKNNRETVTLGHPTLAEIKAKLERQVDKTVRTQSEIAKLAARPGIGEDRSRFAELLETETARADARADAQERALFEGGYGMQVCPTCSGAQLTERRADPGDIVGLDGATPDSDAAGDGDPASTAESSDPS